MKVYLNSQTKSLWNEAGNRDSWNQRAHYDLSWKLVICLHYLHCCHSARFRHCQPKTQNVNSFPLILVILVVCDFNGFQTKSGKDFVDTLYITPKRRKIWNCTYREKPCSLQQMNAVGRLVHESVIGLRSTSSQWSRTLSLIVPVVTGTQLPMYPYPYPCTRSVPAAPPRSDVQPDGNLCGRRHYHKHAPLWPTAATLAH